MNNMGNAQPLYGLRILQIWAKIEPFDSSLRIILKRVFSSSTPFRRVVSRRKVKLPFYRSELKGSSNEWPSSCKYWSAKFEQAKQAGRFRADFRDDFQAKAISIRREINETDCDDVLRRRSTRKKTKIDYLQRRWFLITLTPSLCTFIQSSAVIFPRVFESIELTDGGGKFVILNLARNFWSKLFQYA